MLQGVTRVKKRTKALLWKRKKECKKTNSPESERKKNTKKEERK